jgi:hypothetical protein
MQTSRWKLAAITPVVGIESAACTTPSGDTTIPTYRLTFIPAEPLEDEEGPGESG